MNALAHCVEVVWSPTRTAEAEAIALAGAADSSTRLPRVVADPTDLDARTDARRAPCSAGRWLHNATMGVHHGLSQLVGGRTGIAHGLANAVILPHAMAFNSRRRARGAGGHRAGHRRARRPRRRGRRARGQVGPADGAGDCGVTERGPRRGGPPVGRERQRAGQPAARRRADARGRSSKRPSDLLRRMIPACWGNMAGPPSSARSCSAVRRGRRARPIRTRWIGWST